MQKALIEFLDQYNFLLGDTPKKITMPQKLFDLYVDYITTGRPPVAEGSFVTVKYCGCLVVKGNKFIIE